MAAPPHLLLLHGFTGSGASWREVIESLPEEWTASCPDLVGHASACWVSGVRFEDEVERLRAGLDRGPRRRCHLVGYSLGARVSLGLLATCPEHFESATLIGVNGGLATEAERRARREQDEEWARVLELEGMDVFLEKWAALPLFATQRELDEQRLETQRCIRAGHRAEGLARALRCLGLGSMPDYRTRLAGFERPVRLAVGGLDLKFQRIACEMCQEWPTARLEVVPKAGHNLPLEAPSAVARIVIEVVGAGDRQREKDGVGARSEPEVGRSP